jgi:hypothetical protein
MKNVMKTALRNTKLVMILAFLPALLSAAQAQAVDYKNNYRGVQQTEYRVQTVTTTAPAATFQSTSAYSGQWEEQGSMTPMLNGDGTVNNEAYGVGARHPGRILRTEGGGITPPDGGDDDEKENGTPLGDGWLPLMLLLCAYAIYKVRARKEA